MVTLHHEKLREVRCMSSFFFFNRTDRRLIWVLGVLVLFGLGVWLGRNLDGSKGTGLQGEVQVGDTLGGSEQGSAAVSAAVAADVRPRVFNPNTVDSLTLVACGLESWKVHTFLRYRAAGKQFYSEGDLLDTYGWQADDVRKLRPYLRFGERMSGTAYSSAASPRNCLRTASVDLPTNESTIPHRDKFETHTFVDLNTADTALLQRIPGIGTYYASQIVRLRERLGGYNEVEQVREIRDFPDEAIEWFRVLPSPPIRKLSLTADIPTLGRHPYIGYSRARALHQYQHLYGAIKDSTALAATRIFSAAELKQLLPYIAF